MQVLKEDLKIKILEVAKEEILESGFSGTSMRKIAGKVGIAPSNIYNYFKNKDEIFLELVKPVLVNIERIMETARQKEVNPLSDDPKHMEWHIQLAKRLLYLVTLYKLQLRMLFVCSKGSQLEHFKENVVEKYVQIIYKTKCDEGVSEFFIKSFILSYVNYLEQIVIEDLEVSEIKKYLAERLVFSQMGFHGLIEYDKNEYLDLFNSLNLDDLED